MSKQAALGWVLLYGFELDRQTVAPFFTSPPASVKRFKTEAEAIEAGGAGTLSQSEYYALMKQATREDDNS